MKTFGIILAVILGVLTMGGCSAGLWYKNTYNALQVGDERVAAAERKIAAAFQKRADLLGNAANIAERYASHEKDVFTDVTKARASATQLKLPENATPEQISAFSKSISEQGSAIARLTMVAENYPALKADGQFMAVQKQLHDTELQIGVLRKQYIEQIAWFNGKVRSFPSNWVASNHNVKSKEQIKFDDENTIRKAPVLFAPKK